MQAADDLELLIEAARLGGEVALALWGASPASWDKGGGQGPVSEADIKVDDVLAELLRSARPGYGWLSEESNDAGARFSTDRVFIVDPIDGTRSYLEGAKHWAVSVAVAHRGAVEAAVVALPAMDLAYSAMGGGGARVNGRSILASRRDCIEAARVLAARATLKPEVWGHAGVPPVTRHFRPSLAYRLCLVADGRYDAMLTFRDCWEWDIAAGALIAAEAGATVSDRRGAPLLFNSETATTAGVVAAAPALHSGLLAPDQGS